MEWLTPAIVAGYGMSADFMLDQWIDPCRRYAIILGNVQIAEAGIERCARIGINYHIAFEIGILRCIMGRCLSPRMRHRIGITIGFVRYLYRHARHDVMR